MFRSLHAKKILNFTRKHKSLMHGYGTALVMAILSGVAWSLQSVVAEEVFHSTTMAGIVVAVLTGVQVFLMNPVAGNLADTWGGAKTMRLGLMLNILGALIWLAFDTPIAQFVYFLLYQCGLSLCVFSAFMLQESGEDEGGTLFGIHEELWSLGCFIAVTVLPFFVLYREFFPYFALVLSSIGLVLMWRIRQKHITHEDPTIAETLMAETTPMQTNIRALLSSMNPFATIKGALHFIQANHRFPLFAIGTSAYSGLFYGSVWFLFPLFIAASLGGEGGGDEALSLSIYEIATFLFALIAGVLADRIDWKKLEKYSWSFMIVLVWIMAFWHSPFALIGVGFLIGMTDNFFSSASAHVLAKHNLDKADSGTFASFSSSISDTGYMLAPILVGGVYSLFGFQAALMLIGGMVTIIGIWMLMLLNQLKTPTPKHAPHKKASTAPLRTKKIAA